MKLNATQEELEAALKALDYTLNTLPQLFNAWELEPAQAMRKRLRKMLEEPDTGLTADEALAEIERLNQMVLQGRKNPERANKRMARMMKGLEDDRRGCGYGPRGGKDDD